MSGRLDWRKAKVVRKDDDSRKSRIDMRADRYLAKVDGDRWLTPKEKRREREKREK